MNTKLVSKLKFVGIPVAAVLVLLIADCGSGGKGGSKDVSKDGDGNSGGDVTVSGDKDSGFDDIIELGTAKAIVEINSNDLIDLKNPVKGWWVEEKHGRWLLGEMQHSEAGNIDIPMLSTNYTNLQLSEKTFPNSANPGTLPGGIGTYSAQFGKSSRSIITATQYAPPFTYSGSIDTSCFKFDFQISIPNNGISVRVEALRNSVAAQTSSVPWAPETIILADEPRLVKGELVFNWETPADRVGWIVLTPHYNYPIRRFVVEIDATSEWYYEEKSEKPCPIFQQGSLDSGTWTYAPIYYWKNGEGGLWNLDSPLHIISFKPKGNGENDTIIIRAYDSSVYGVKWYDDPDGDDIKMPDISKNDYLAEGLSKDMYIDGKKVGDVKVELINHVQSGQTLSSVDVRITYTLDSIFAGYVKSMKCKLNNIDKQVTCDGLTGIVDFEGLIHGRISLETEFAFE